MRYRNGAMGSYTNIAGGLDLRQRYSSLEGLRYACCELKLAHRRRAAECGIYIGQALLSLTAWPVRLELNVRGRCLSSWSGCCWGR